MVEIQGTAEKIVNALNGFSGLMARFNINTSVSDLRPFDIVVKLGKDPKNDDGSIVYVGQNGDGSIKKIPNSILESHNPAQVKFYDLKTLSDNGIKVEQKAAAALGAKTIMDNFSHVNHNGRLPFDMEHPEKSTAESLPQIRDILNNLRADLYNNASPEGAFDGKAIINNKESHDQAVALANQVDGVFKRVDTALKLPEYRADLAASASATITMDPAQKAAINNTLSGAISGEPALRLPASAKP